MEGKGGAKRGMRVEYCGIECLFCAVRLFLSTVLLFLAALPVAAQKGIPLPQGDPLPLPELEPEPKSTPGLPRVEMAPSAPAFPKRATPAPRIKMTPGAGPEESSVIGGQFRIFGKVKEQRDVLLDEAEATRRMVAAALGMEPVFRFPIVLQIREASALRAGQPAVWSAVSQTDDGFRFDVNLVPLHNAVDGPLLRQELVRALLAEMLLRPYAATDMGGRDMPPPDWLLHGVLELLDYQALGRPSEGFSAVFKLGRVLSIEDIFEADPRGMDSVSRMIYRSSCCGLLLMLKEQKRGEQSLKELFKILAVSGGDDATAIARACPDLNLSGNSLGKWWSLQLATMAQPGMDELLSPRETEELLVKALVLELPAEKTVAAAKPKKGLAKIFAKKDKGETKAEEKTVTTPAQSFPLEEYSRVLGRKDREAILERVNLSLTGMALRAHPIYRPIISDYQSVLKALTAGKKEKEAAATIASLAAVRRKLLRDLQKAEDYLDWSEATQGDGLTGAFDGYLRTAEELGRPAPPRRDPLSRYLNLMESEYKPED